MKQIKIKKTYFVISSIYLRNDLVLSQRRCSCGPKCTNLLYQRIQNVTNETVRTRRNASHTVCRKRVPAAFTDIRSVPGNDHKYGYRPEKRHKIMRSYPEGSADCRNQNIWSVRLSHCFLHPPREAQKLHLTNFVVFIIDAKITLESFVDLTIDFITTGVSH